MESNAGGYSAAQINYNTPSVAEMLDKGSALNEQRNYRNQELAMQQARLQQEKNKQQQEDETKQYAWAQAATDPTKYISGQTAVDQHAQSALGTMLDQMVADIHTHTGDLGTLMAKYQPALQNVANGHLIAKQQLDNAYKQIDDASKDDHNWNTAALKQRAFEEVRKSVLDDNGQYRAPDQIDPNRDIAGSLLNAPDSYKYILGAQPLMDLLGSNKGEDTKALTQLPNGTIVTHSGNLSDFQQRDWTVGTNGFANKLPTFSIKTQNVPDPGNPNATVPVLDKGVFDKTFGQDAPGANQRQFLALWNHYKEGVGLQTTPQNEDIYKQMYARVLVQDKVKNQMQQTNAEHLPKQGNTIINMGNQPKIHDIWPEIKQLGTQLPDGSPRPLHTDKDGQQFYATPLNQFTTEAQQVLLEQAGVGGKIDSDGKATPVKNADIYLRTNLDGSKVLVNKETQQPIGRIDYAGVNLDHKIGNTTKAQKQQVLTNAQKATTTTPPPAHATHSPSTIIPKGNVR